MIVRPRPHIWQLLFIMRGSIVPRIWPQILAVTAIAAVLVAIERTAIVHLPTIGPLPFSLVGIALSIFAGFRNSACYDRWWEARKILGQLVIECRNLARAVAAYVPASQRTEKEALSLLVIAFVEALRGHLRGSKPDDEEAIPSPASNRPNAVLDEMSVRVGRLVADGTITDRIAQILEERIAGLSAVLAACERIKTTPLPYAYTLLLHRTCYAFCLLLPFGLMESAGFATPLFAAVVSYTFFGLDILGDELERPFSPGDNALPLDAISRTIEINVRETAGLGALPRPIEPIGYVLT